MAQLVKNMPAIWETWVQPLRWEDPPVKGMVTYSSILAMINSRGCIVHGIAESWTRLNDFHFQQVSDRSHSLR